uniref:Putative middle protein n=1 Tax=Protoparvovirus primate3 TaxID=3052716 RepID=A0A649ZVU3_9VIRU|nr:putative middle protein [Protoparvovirus primate3]
MTLYLGQAMPVLLGFILMLICFLFFLYLFLNGLINFHSPSNLFRPGQRQPRRSLVMGFLPTLLSFSLTLLIWALFIWLYYFGEHYIITTLIINCNGTNITYTFK